MKQTINKKAQRMLRLARGNRQKSNSLNTDLLIKNTEYGLEVKLQAQIYNGYKTEYPSSTFPSSYV